MPVGDGLWQGGAVTAADAVDVLCGAGTLKVGDVIAIAIASLWPAAATVSTGDESEGARFTGVFGIATRTISVCVVGLFV